MGLFATGSKAQSASRSDRSRKGAQDNNKRPGSSSRNAVQRRGREAHEARQTSYRSRETTTAARQGYRQLAACMCVCPRMSSGCLGSFG
ncbi:hypothetical protein M441DRAFT_62072 [Trichoderma asperellum CBS 433.97]|uniref:Uncharacterized protein n=1 Tax=Trichoderma asperellum (strain ATCC 204424 / CBS 433.97 / NBRC 101777) TaxID=1042311 RepID=A0A2T3YVP0_TRIA4|nr:hypothetical protein M441DRAFT_62072 [Trichoderma asperellum CBS 433.97]PTB36604.1 hypothetical protein M441DRAFT_62072 [Trichoderma asperellum CBS 433.97]